MKNKKLLLGTLVGVSAIALAACSGDTEKPKKDEKVSALSAQEQIEKALKDLSAAKTLQGTGEFKIELDKASLTASGLTDEEIKELEQTIKSSNIVMDLAMTEDMAEMIIKIDASGLLGMEDVKSEIEVPVVLDLKNEKAYMGTDWVIDILSVMLDEILSDESIDAEALAEYKTEFENAKSELKTGKFIDLSQTSEEGFFAEMGFEDVIDSDFIFKSTGDVETVAKLIKSISKDAFVINEDKSATLKVPKDKLEEFSEVTGFVDLSSPIGDTDELSLSSSVESIVEYHDSIENVEVTTKLDGKNKVELFQVSSDKTLDEYKAKEIMTLKDLKLDGNVKTKYSIDKLDLMSSDEEAQFTEDISGWLMIVMFAAMSAGFEEEVIELDDLE